MDRTADVKLAAKELVAARFAFGGTSPYAPDLVLVNEFVKQAFLQAVADECREGSTGTRSREGKASGANKLDEQLQALKKVDPRLQIVVQEAKAAIAELSAREAQALSTKDEASIMKVIPIRSLDDAIDLIGNTSTGAALAAYHFGTPAVGKYLAQFIDARASFINHVPRSLLVGPAYPATHALELSARYTPDMFSWARPGFANVQPSSASLAAQLEASDSVAVQKVLKQALAPLKAMKRKPGGGVGMAFCTCVSSPWTLRADFFCSRLLRAGFLDECWLDTHLHHQCDSGRECVVVEECEDAVVREGRSCEASVLPGIFSIYRQELSEASLRQQLCRKQCSCQEDAALGARSPNATPRALVTSA